jgi:tetratricopeptide (TPR) repeat protein
MDAIKRNAALTTLAICMILTMPLVCFADGLTKGDIPATTSSGEALELFIQGRDAFEMGRLSDATVLFDKALQKDGRFASAWLYKAYASGSDAEWKGNMEKAVHCRTYASEGEKLLIDIALTYASDDSKERYRLANQLATLYPGSARALLIKAGEYQLQGDFSKFRDLAQEAIAREPGSPLGYRALAASWLFNDPVDFDLAQKHMLKFVELRPNEASSHIALGDIYRANLDLELAMVNYQKAAIADPSSSIALSKLAYVQTYMGRFDEARANFKRASALNLNPEGVRANGKISSYLFPGTGRIDDPGDELVEAVIKKTGKKLTMDGNSDNCFFCCTFVSMNSGFHIAQKSQLTACRCLQYEFEKESCVPDAKTVESNIAFVESIRALQQNNFEQARQMAAQYAELTSPEIPANRNEAYNFLMGMIHQGEGHHTKAVTSFLRSDASNVCVKFNLGISYDKLHRFDEAKQMFADVAACEYNTRIKPQLIRNSENWLKSLEVAMANEE